LVFFVVLAMPCMK